MSQTKTISIHKAYQEKVEEVEDQLIVEYPFTIFLDDEEFITLLCSPSGLSYLAIGFLLSEGMIKNKDQIKEIKIHQEKGHGYVYLNTSVRLAEKLHGKRTLTTGCGKGTVFYNVLDSLGTKKIIDSLKIPANSIYQLMEMFNRQSTLFKETGGVHSCGLCEGEEILLFHEDVGRHNALDKLIGEATMKNIDLTNKILITSGRISSEMIIKSSKQGIPVIISRSAPTNLSYEIAKELGVTLIGFARGRKMNIYHDENRVYF